MQGASGTKKGKKGKKGRQPKYPKFSEQYQRDLLEQMRHQLGQEQPDPGDALANIERTAEHPTEND